MEGLLSTIASHLSQYHQTVTCAESCAGGLLSGAFTSVTGSSQWFYQSWVTYSNQAKQQLLGVHHETLLNYGAVSAETVREMAQGARLLADADYALSISGIAGPGGGSKEKPVGTVWFGLATANQVITCVQHFDGNRENIRQQAVAFALGLLVDNLFVYPEKKQRL
ncbi:CinA family protein [Neisseria animalis]|uniref:CinA family protein n=1 Tax=Neisseria animalis TaxID=492 RepID=A0A5P3MTT7_NEIAN|nr:CinA family protein [Neisseria animalis]QEY24984.1 CinA family protein [Neisseria animalis]ROW32693.1 CinA family protein [Neisseria animalis]VEE06034.1 Competence/damage-inducible protein CinA C-terminal domain [Neisseria animalis]